MTWRAVFWTTLISFFMVVQTAMCFQQQQTAITVLSVEDEVMTYKNTSTVPVGAVIVRKSTGEYQWADYSQNGGMQPGAVEKFPSMGTNATIANTEVPEVILQTGQVLGTRAKEFDGKVDLAQEIFDYRAGQADDVADWTKIVASLPRDHEAAVKQFLAIAAEHIAKLPPPETPVYAPQGEPNDYYAQGRRLVENQICFIATHQAVEPGSDAATVHTLLLQQWLPQLLEGSSHSVVKEQK